MKTTLDYDSVGSTDSEIDKHNSLENTQLCHQYARRVPLLEDRYYDLRLQVARLKTRVKKLEERGNSLIFTNPLLPFELWQIIFASATQFHSFTPLLPGDTPESRNLEWKMSLRLRKAIVQVCAAWRQAGRRFVFEHIVLSEIPQLAGIVHILEQSSNDGSVLGRWVRTIKIDFVVMPHWHRFYDTHTARLIHCCPKLISFIDRVTYSNSRASFFRHHSLPESIPQILLGPGRLPLVMLAISSDNTIKLSTLIAIAPSLKYLTLGVIEVDTERPIKIDMPNLEYLDIHASGTFHTAPQESITSMFGDGYNWNLPSLRSFTNCGTVAVPRGRFFPLYGSSLTSINLLSYSRGLRNMLFLKDVLDPCPQLLHLAFNLQHLTASATEHPSHHLLSHIAIGNLLPTEMEFIPRKSRTAFSVEQPDYIKDLFQLLKAKAFPAMQRIWAVDDNEDGIIDPYPLPWKTYQVWKKWLPYWKARGVRLENKDGAPLKLYRLAWQTLKDSGRGMDVDYDNDLVLTDDECTDWSGASDHSARSLIVSDDGSDCGFQYRPLPDIEISTSDEEEGRGADEAMQNGSAEEIDEEMALEIFNRVVEV